MALRKAFRKTGFALRAFHDENLHVCRRVLPIFTPTRLHGAEERRDFDANYELRLIKVCDEVSMRLCFWLAAAISTRQERLPSLLVDPACMLKLAWCKYMQGSNSALAEIEGCRRCHVAATTVDNSRTVVAPVVQMLCALFSFFVPEVVAQCIDVAGSSTRRTRGIISLNSTHESTSLCFLVS